MGKSVGRILAVSAVNVLSTDLSVALRLFSIVSMALNVSGYVSIMSSAVDPAILLMELSGECIGSLVHNRQKTTSVHQSFGTQSPILLYCVTMAREYRRHIGGISARMRSLISKSARSIRNDQGKYHIYTYKTHIRTYMGWCLYQTCRRGHRAVGAQPAKNHICAPIFWYAKPDSALLCTNRKV